MKLLSLPDEIILQIANHLNDHQTRPSEKFYHKLPPCPSHLLPLNRVCRRLNILTDAQLYKRIRVDLCQPRTYDILYGLTDSKQIAKSWFAQCGLQEAFERKPYRYTFIDHLDLAVEALSIRSYAQLIHELFARLKDSCKVRIYYTAGDRELMLDSPIFDVLDTKKLQMVELNLHFIRRVSATIMPFDIQHSLLFHPDQLDAHGTFDVSWWQRFQLPLARRGIMSLRSLQIVPSPPTWHPCALLPLLMWATGLESLYIDFQVIINNGHEDFSLAQLQDMLEIHSTTLRSVTLTSYTHMPKPVPNFQHFPHLRQLYLSHGQLFPMNPGEAASKLAAPCLERLAIDMDLELPEHQTIIQIEDQQYCWLRDFGRSYRSCMPDGPFRQIELVNLLVFLDHEQIMCDCVAALKSCRISLSWYLNLEEYELKHSDGGV